MFKLSHPYHLNTPYTLTYTEHTSRRLYLFKHTQCLHVAHTPNSSPLHLLYNTYCGVLCLIHIRHRMYCMEQLYSFASRLEDTSEGNVPKVVSYTKNGSYTQPKGVVLFKTLKSEWTSDYVDSEYHSMHSSILREPD